jgi:rod shape-determining protein MreD
MMSNLRFGFFLVVLFFAHLLFYQYLPAGRIYPDLFLVLVIFASLNWGAEAGTVLGFLTGLTQDSFSFTFFGLHALCKTVIGFAIGKTRQGFYSNNILVQAIIIFTAKVAQDLLFYAVYLSREPGSFWHQILIETPLSALYTCFLGLAIYYLVKLRS